MRAMGRHSPPLDGAIANGHQLVPLAPAALQQLGPVSAMPRENTPNGAEQPRTAPNERERRTPDGTAFIVVALFTVAQVAVVAFSGSWQHQYELSIQLGQAHWVAGMQPLSVEGLIASATLVIWYAARYGCGIPLGAYLVLAAGVGQTVLMNLGADYRWPWLGPEISVWPAVAFVAAYEMAVWLVRKRQDVAARAEHDAAPEDRTATGDTAPSATARDRRDKLRADKATVVAARLKIETDRVRASRDTTAVKPGLSIEEEAARDGVSPGAVRKRRERARKAAAGKGS